jgi:hypothetical protein
MSMDIQEDPIFYKLCIGTVGNRQQQVFVGGKIDGISSDRKTVIEIKNRINHLFGINTPLHELIQCQTYMYLLDVQQAQLVECLKENKTKRPLINSIHLYRDTRFWEGCIVPRLLAVASFLIDLKDNDSLADRFLHSPSSTLRGYMKQNHQSLTQKSSSYRHSF